MFTPFTNLLKGNDSKDYNNTDKTRCGGPEFITYTFRRDLKEATDPECQSLKSLVIKPWSVLKMIWNI